MLGQGLHFISNNIIILLLVAAGVAAGWIWKALPDPAAPRPAAATAEKWQLPTHAEPDHKKNAEAIVARNLWGAVVKAQDVPLNDPEWRFAGVFRNGPERYVLISIDKKPAEMRKEGDTLPGGSKILKISEDNLCVLVNGKRRTLEVYRR